MLSMRRGTSKKSQFVSVFGVQDGGTARGLFNLIQSHVARSESSAGTMFATQTAMLTLAYF
jgi:hypothetical protein